MPHEGLSLTLAYLAFRDDGCEDIRMSLSVQGGDKTE